MGDIDHSHEDGYLDLGDGKDFEIISNGINIYPQETEMQSIQHPDVANVAVFGIPNGGIRRRGQGSLSAINWPINEEDMALTLKEWLRSFLSHVKIPRSIDFKEALTRLDNGKIYELSTATI